MQLQASYDLKRAAQDKNVIESVSRIVPVKQIETSPCARLRTGVYSIQLLVTSFGLSDRSLK